MITMLKADGFKNLCEREVQIAQRTLLVGRNGSGKTALASIPTVACTGALPGGKQKDMAANLSKPVASVSFSTDDGHAIIRTFAPNGKTKEAIEIDGVKMSGQAADGALALLFKNNPPTFDVSAFFALGPSEMRRNLIERVCGSKAAQMLATEEKARDAKKRSAANRLAAQKALNQLAGSLAWRPVGDVTALQSESQAVTAELAAARGIVTEADRKAGVRTAAARLQGKEDVLREELHALTADGEASATLLLEAQKDVQEAEATPATELDGELQLSMERARERVHEMERQTASGLARMVAEGIEGAPGIMTTLAGAVVAVEKLSPFAERYQEVDELRLSIRSILPPGVVDLPTADQWQRTVAGAAATLHALEDQAEQVTLEHARLRDEHIVALSAVMSAAQSALDTIEKKTAAVSVKLGTIEEARQAQGAADDTDAENNARITLTTAEDRLADIQRRINDLAKWTAIEGEIAKARQAFEDATAKAGTDDKTLDAAIAEIEKTINIAAVNIKVSSIDVLPRGCVEVESADGDIAFAYRTEGRRVRREGLSGGEKVLFDAAVGHALAPSALVLVEGAEVDDGNLVAAMASLQACDFQVMICTCHPIAEVPAGWSVLTP